MRVRVAGSKYQPRTRSLRNHKSNFWADINADMIAGLRSRTSSVSRASDVCCQPLQTWTQFYACFADVDRCNFVPVCKELTVLSFVMIDGSIDSPWLQRRRRISPAWHPNDTGTAQSGLSNRDATLRSFFGQHVGARPRGHLTSSFDHPLKRVVKKTRAKSASTMKWHGSAQ
jgi:hypothetical protein